MNHIFGVAYGEQGKLLGASVGHVDRDREELLEEKEKAKGNGNGVALKRKIDGQSKGSGQLEKSAARHGDKFAKPAKEQMAAFVNGDENDIEQTVAGSSFLEHDRRVKGYRDHQSSTRNRQPIFLERLEKGRRSVSDSGKSIR